MCAHVYVQIRCVSFCVSLDSGRVLSYRLGWMDLSQRSHRMLFALKVCMSAATLMSSVPEPGTQISVCVCLYVCRVLLWNVFSLDCWAKQLFARELKQANLAWRDLVDLRSPTPNVLIKGSVCRSVVLWAPANEVPDFIWMPSAAGPQRNVKLSF